jgi:hypothetical protein
MSRGFARTHTDQKTHRSGPRLSALIRGQFSYSSSFRKISWQFEQVLLTAL